MQEALLIRPCNLQDLNQLKEISRLTFRQTFEAFNTEEDMKAYEEEALTLDRLEREWHQEGAKFYFLERCLSGDTELVGYMKLNTGSAQTEPDFENTLEIQRLYILAAHKRKGYGQRLMDYAISQAKLTSLKAVWLGVWEHNQPALGFYRKNGFKKIGAHVFLLGGDEQIDELMMLEL